MNEADIAPRSGVLIYDRECRLCQATVAWFRRRDHDGRLAYLAAQDNSVPQRFPQLTGLDLLAEITLVSADGKTDRGADAIVSALLLIPRWRLLAATLRWSPAWPLRRGIYRWIAGNRYRWFGSAANLCEPGVCQTSVGAIVPEPRQDAVPRSFGKTFPTIASIVLLVAVLSPVRENWKDKGNAVDSFPLSYYPMFSSRRADVHRQPHAIGIRADGETFPVPYKLLGTGGLNQVRRQLGRLIRDDDPEPLRQMLVGAASEIADSGKKRYRDCVAVAAVRGRYDLDQYFSAREKESVRTSVLLSVPVPGREPIDLTGFLAGDDF